MKEQCIIRTFCSLPCRLHLWKWGFYSEGLRSEVSRCCCSAGNASLFPPSWQFVSSADRQSVKWLCPWTWTSFPCWERPERVTQSLGRRTRGTQAGNFPYSDTLTSFCLAGPGAAWQWHSLKVQRESNWANNCLISIYLVYISKHNELIHDIITCSWIGANPWDVLCFRWCSQYRNNSILYILAFKFLFVWMT